MTQHIVNDRTNIFLAVSATGQTLANISRTIGAQTLAARLATAYRFFVLVIETTHRFWGARVWSNIYSAKPGFGLARGGLA